MSLSIIIPVYNVELYIAECINSILKEIEIDLEIIVINDGSTDNSLLIAKSIANHDDRIKIFNYKNEGLSVARNRGIKHSSNKYILFLDSDDKLDISRLKLIYKQLCLNDLDCLFFEATIFYDCHYAGKCIDNKYQRPLSLVNKVMTGEFIFNQLILQQKFFPSACMYILKRELLETGLKFFEGIYHEDNLFTTKLCLLEKSKRFSCCKIALYQRRIRSNSIMTERKTLRHIEGYEIVFDELSPFLSELDNSLTKKCLTIFMTSILKAMCRIVVLNDIKNSSNYNNIIKKKYLSILVNYLSLKDAFFIFFPYLLKIKLFLISIKLKK
jgi:glycosyltransferase involved in cell wall biosynthesis